MVGITVVTILLQIFVCALILKTKRKIEMPPAVELVHIYANPNTDNGDVARRNT